MSPIQADKIMLGSGRQKRNQSRGKVVEPRAKSIGRARETLNRHGMIDKGDRIIVAVSGGPDSVCLLDILHRLREEMGIELLVAHFDHGLRPREDEAETRFVHDLALSMGLSFESEKGHLTAETGGVSIEEKARDARYAFLEDLSNRHQAKKIAVGHTLNDQAETVIMRLLRGSGPSGLAGIPPVRDKKIIRPLIDISREEILSYLKAGNLSYVTDSSNLQRVFLRNRIRLDLMPRLLDYQPRLIEHLGRLAQLLRDENLFMDMQADQWLKNEAEPAPEGSMAISVTRFLDLSRPLKNRVTRGLLLQVQKNLRRISGAHILSVNRLAESPDPQGELHLPGGLRVKKAYESLVFSRFKEPRQFKFRIPIHGPGTFHLERISRSVSLEYLDAGIDPTRQTAPDVALLDAGKIRFPLLLRNFEPGDRFIPLGMKGRKKIKDFFIDLKIPSGERAQTPILAFGDIPVWVCGYRIDDRFKITPATKAILKITIT